MQLLQALDAENQDVRASGREGREEAKVPVCSVVLLSCQKLLHGDCTAAPCWHSAKHSVVILHYLHAFAILLCTVGINEEVMDSFQDTN